MPMNCSPGSPGSSTGRRLWAKPATIAQVIREAAIWRVARRLFNHEGIAARAGLHERTVGKILHRYPERYARTVREVKAMIEGDDPRLTKMLREVFSTREGEE